MRTFAASMAAQDDSKPPSLEYILEDNRRYSDSAIDQFKVSNQIASPLHRPDLSPQALSSIYSDDSCSSDSDSSEALELTECVIPHQRPHFQYLTALPFTHYRQQLWDICAEDF